MNPGSTPIPFCGPGFYVLACQEEQPCGPDHVLEQIWVAARWIGAAADHPGPDGRIAAVARFNHHADAAEFARQLRIHLIGDSP